MKKIAALLITVILLMGIFTGCGQQTTDAQKEAEQATASTGTEETSNFPLTVKDASGFEMKLANKPQKIVSLTLATDEMLLSIVDKRRIKAMTFYVDDVNVSNVADAAKGVGERVDSNAEKVIALQPDLVFVSSMFAKPDFIQQLRDSNITVYAFNNPYDIEGQKKVILDIAHVVGEDEKGQEVADWMDNKLKAVDEKLQKLKPEEKLTVVDYSEMGTSSGKGTNFDDIITRAGMINLVSKDGLEGWPQLSKEMIIKYNPDIICIPGWYYDQKNNLEAMTASIKGDKALAEVKAVKNGKLIALPYAHISALSQYAVLGVEDAAKAAYPQLFN